MPHHGREGLPGGRREVGGVTRRDRLAGHRYSVNASVQAEVRRSCRDELKIIYEAPCFDQAAWDKLFVLGEVKVLRASQLNPKMKDLYRVYGDSLRLEGALGGQLLLAFFARKGKLAARHLLEAVLRTSL